MSYNYTEEYLKIDLELMPHTGIALVRSFYPVIISMDVLSILCFQQYILYALRFEQLYLKINRIF